VQNTTKHSQFNNSWYKPGKGALVRMLWYCANNLLLKSGMPGSGWRRALLKLFGATVGKSVVLKPHINIKYPWRLKIGAYSWIGEDVWIDNLGEVSIGSHCCLSQGAMLLCGNHHYGKTTFDLMVGDITLEDGVWIGAKSVVCPGVVCKSHAVLSVGSIATSDLQAYAIYAGNPAKLVRERKIEG
jgi:putative colanic acid biosynthesis acetyltransferase WcaF